MNALFHTTAAFGIAVLITDTNPSKSGFINKNKIMVGLLSFSAALISHGILDYLPHCYPINSKVDLFLSFIVISLLLFLSNKEYRLILAFAFLGGVFPDIIDLSPKILNNYFALSIPLSDPFFPWHWKKYSGSIYDGNCSISTIIHLLLIISVIGLCWLKRKDIKRIFRMK